MDSGEVREKLRKLVTELYESCGVDVEVMYPKILVRVLPKAQKISRIILPDNQKQNKPVLEGLVLKTWRPFYQKIYLTQANWVKDDPEPNVRYTQKVESSVKPGDHILFPYIEFGIVPVEPLDQGKGDYRLIPEDLVLGKLVYRKQTMRKFLTELIGEMPLRANPDEIAEGLLEHADVIRKDVESKTISGR